MDTYVVSLLKAWWGDAATADNDFCFDYLPRISGDHSTYQTTLDDDRRHGPRLLRDGGEPGRRLRERQAAAARARGRGLAGRARLLRDRDARRSGTTRPRSRPASCGPTRSAPRCSSCLPPRTPRRTAASRTRSGCCSGTTRPSSRRATRAPSCGSCTTSAVRIREMLATSTDRARPPAARPHVGLPDRGRRSRSRARKRCCARSTAPVPTATRSASYTEVAGRRLDHVRVLDLLRLLRRRREPDAAAPARVASRAGSRPSGAGHGRRTGACSTTARRPIPTVVRGRSASATSSGTPTTASGRAPTSPTSSPTAVPTTCHPKARPAGRRVARRRAVHHAGRRRRLPLRARGREGRPVPDALRTPRVAVRATRSTACDANPTVQTYRRARQRRTTPSDGEPGADVLPVRR